MLEVKLEQFEGPLDLLLQLIEKEQLDITELSLSRVTDEYLEKIQGLSEVMRLDELADFLVVAARLILIKSKTLLPYLTPAEEEEIEEFTTSLRVYQLFHESARLLGRLYASERRTFPRPAVIREDVPVFSPPPSLTSQMLSEVFEDIIARLEPPAPPKPVLAFGKQVSVHEKISELKDLLHKKMTVRFLEVCKKAESKAEIIASFLATLELVKQRLAHVSQEKPFEEIEVTTTSSH